MTEKIEGYLQRFVEESNRIEGIPEVREGEVRELHDFLARDLSIATVEDLVTAFTRGARLRSLKGMDVWIGDHTPPRGGAEVVAKLDRLLERIRHHELRPWEAHIIYEMLHPFEDGNGRSGRAIWLWMMVRDANPAVTQERRLFLHEFYYQTLSEDRQIRDKLTALIEQTVADSGKVLRELS